MTKLNHQTRTQATAALLAILSGFLVMKIPQTAGFMTRLSFDLPYLFHSSTEQERPADPEIAVLHLDEISRDFFDQDPDPELWERRHHAQLIRILDQHHARAIVFDLLFDRPSRDAAQDKELAEAIAESSCPVILAGLRIDEPGRTRVASDTTTVIKAIPALAQVASWGVMTQPTEKDRVIRRHYYDESYPNLAWRTLEELQAVPGELQGDEWINFKAAARSIDYHSYSSAFELQALPAGYFSNKVVLIGLGRMFSPSQGTAMKNYRTPESRWHGSEFTGVEVHAMILSDLMHETWLTEMSLPLEWLFLIGLGGLAGYGIGQTQSRSLLFVVLAGMATVAALHFIAVQVWQIWFPWMVGAAIQIPVAAGWSAWRQARGFELEKATDENMDPLTGDREKFGSPVPDHELLARIGRGSYGEVWLARNTVGILHATKMVYLDNFETDTPYEREFEGITKFMPISRTHKGLLNILHVGRNVRGKYFYYVMELGDDLESGQDVDANHYQPHTLSNVLKRNRHLEFSHVLSLGLTLSAALEHLHQQNLTHRDIKPSNIIYVNGVPKLGDIGLVTELGKDSRTYVGTEGYIPPEGPGHAPADVFSLGKVIYEACMGRGRLDFPDLPTSIVESAEQPENKKRLLLNQIILKACEHDVQRRYQSAAELHADLFKLKHLQDLY